MFSKPATDLLTLKSCIQAEIGKIRREMSHKVCENALARFHICIGNDGHHLQNIILK